jgi:hypothetical protein
LLCVCLLLWSLGLVSVETCLQSHSLATTFTFGSPILALSLHITVLPQCIFWGMEEPHLKLGWISNDHLFWLPNSGIEPSYHSVAPAPEENRLNLGWIWGSHSGNYEEICLLACNSMQSSESWLSFIGMYQLFFQGRRVNQTRISMKQTASRSSALLGWFSADCIALYPRRQSLS